MRFLLGLGIATVFIGIGAHTFFPLLMLVIQHVPLTPSQNMNFIISSVFLLMFGPIWLICFTAYFKNFFSTLWKIYRDQKRN